jgi:predicted flap endonuclease-1-like 5' DNA nuclease
MSLLYRIVYAAHANGTHHKLALDALEKLKHPEAEAWQRVFLKHVALYLEGSKDPDNKFKDFKNHVLHVRDDYWGGAPEKVQNWYQHTVAALQAQNWSEAVYAAGVLSHYYTDPIHPFHTGQTEAENNIHRAVEWSINRSYDALKGLAGPTQPDIAIGDGPQWLREMTLKGADYSNQYYEKLIAHYDLTRGVSDPPAGLDVVGRTLVAQLIAYASTGFARILDRALTEGGQAPPAVTLTADTIVAGLRIPVKALQKRLSNAADRATVQAMYDELKATGTVDKALPEDDRVVRDLYAAEVLEPRRKAADATRQKRLIAVPSARQRVRTGGATAAPPAPATSAVASDAGTSTAKQLAADEITEPAEVIAEATPLAPPAAAPGDGGTLTETTAAPSSAAVDATSRDEAQEPTASDSVMQGSEPPEPVASEPETEELDVAALAAAKTSARAAWDDAARVVSVASVASASREGVGQGKVYLAASDEIERAPSIGPKTAERLIGVGVHTVADFLEEDAEQLSTMLGRRALSSRILKDWQDQARLVMTIAGLRGTHAQLLVGAGYRDAAAVAEADAEELCAALARFALTTEGRSILREGNAPDIAKIKAWVDGAAQAIAA